MPLTKNILITGGTGFIGKAMRSYLDQLGYKTGVLTRNPNDSRKNFFYWDPENHEMDPEAIPFADYIIHLAGENIAAKKWTAVQKKKIIESRTKTTAFLLEQIKKSDSKPGRIISASAIGFYGQSSSEKIYSESDDPGNDFVAETVIAWEKALDAFETTDIPVTRLRIGIVLSRDGGALKKMIPAFRLGLGTAFGTGNQYMPWISLQDLIRMFHFVLENDFPGEVFNAVSPQHIRHKEFMNSLAKALKRPYFLPAIPSFFLKAALGEMSVLLLEGSRVSSEKILRAGFEFRDTSLFETLRKEFRESQ